MRSQRERDEQTVTIATGLAIFVGILVMGALTGAAIQAVTGLPGDSIGTLAVGSVLIAALVTSLAYLVRHRRP